MNPPAPSSRPPLLELQSVTAAYGTIEVLHGVDLAVPEGSVVALLGPNGAGKTTTINMLCTLLKPSGGSARIAGHDVATDQNGVRQAIGLIFQEPTLDERLTAWQNLTFHALLYDVDRTLFDERTAELLEMVDLTDRIKDSVKKYSGGMKRRLEIARGLLHRPRVLFLDEPTIGLDPQTRSHIWEYLHRVRESEGTTLFLTTHYMDEAEQCDRIAVIDHGEIIALDTPENLKGLVGGDVVTIAVEDGTAVTRVLSERLDLETRSGADETLVVEVDNGGAAIPRIIDTLTSEGHEVTSVQLARPTLEDVFIKLTGRTIREDEASSAEQARNNMRHAARRHG
jgi:ABC-2 type transport system ATP-binding protein